MKDISPLLEAAIAMHELFTRFIEAGFTEKQAIMLVAEFVITSQKAED